MTSACETGADEGPVQVGAARASDPPPGRETARKPGQLTVKRDRRGRLYVRPYLGRSRVTGRPSRPWHYLAATDEAEALEEARAWYDELVGNRRLADALGRYVDMCGKSANSRRTWRMLKDRYVVPYVGSLGVRDLTTSDLIELYDLLLHHGGRDGGPLSASTVLSVHWLLRGAYRWFVKRDWCDGNPALDADKPSPVMTEAEALEERDVAALEERVDRALGRGEVGDAWLAMVAAEVALHAGLRCGEVCGLRRRDVRLAARDLHVAGTVVEGGGDGPRRKEGTKGGPSRTVKMDRRLADVLERATRSLDDALGGRPGPDAPLLTRGGGFLSPGAVASAFAAECRDMGLPAGTHFHTLRHTHASVLVASGVDVRTVAERLGHASTSTTLKYYAHLLPGRDEAAAEAFARAVGRAAGERR